MVPTTADVPIIDLTPNPQNNDHPPDNHSGVTTVDIELNITINDTDDTLIIGEDSGLEIVLSDLEKEVDPLWIGVELIDFKDRTKVDELRTKDSVKVETIKGERLTKSYFAHDKRLLITKDKEVLIDLELTSPYIKSVPAGEDVLVAEFMLNDWDSKRNFINKIKYYDIKQGYKEVNKTFNFKYGVDYVFEECDENIDTRKFECYNMTGTNWSSFNSFNELSHKNVKIGLFTDTIFKEEIEWIPTINGFEILEFAEYVVTIEPVGSYVNADLINFPTDVWVDGDYAYVTAGTNKTLSIFNISAHGNPILLGSYQNVTSLSSVKHVKIVGNYAYTISSISDTLAVFDISGHGDPVQVGAYSDSSGDYSLDGGAGLDVVGDYAYTVATTDSVFAVFDISGHGDPSPVGTYYSISGADTLNNARDIVVVGDYAYTTSGADDTFSIWNISAHGNPVFLGNYTSSTGKYSIEDPTGIFVLGDYAYVTGFTASSIVVFDISAHDNPVPVGAYNNSAANTEYDLRRANHPFVLGDYAYVCGYYGDRLSIFNISAHVDPVPVVSVRYSSGAYSLDGMSSIYVIGEYGWTTSTADDTLAVFHFFYKHNLTITDPTTASPKSVNDNSNITIQFLYQIGNVNMTSGVTVDNVTIGTGNATILTNPICTGTLNCTQHSTEATCENCSQCNWSSGELSLRAGDDTSSDGYDTTSFSAMADTNFVALATPLTDTDVVYSSKWTAKTTTSASYWFEDDWGYNEPTNYQYVIIEHGHGTIEGNHYECGTNGVSGSTHTITFGTNFPDTNYAVICNPGTDTDSPICILQDTIGKAISGFTVVHNDDQGSPETTVSVDWCAFEFGDYSVGDLVIKSGAKGVTDGAMTIDFTDEGLTDYVDTSFVAMIMDATSYSDDGCACEVTGRTTTGFTAICADDDSSTANCDETFDWVTFTIIDEDVINEECSVIPSGSCSSCEYVNDCVNCSGCSQSSSQDLAWQSATGWNLNVTVPSGLSGLQDLFLNATYDGNTANDTQTEAINYVAAPADTCSCPGSGDWVVTCSDNCSISSNCDIAGNDLIINGGSGTFTILANITADMIAIDDNCEVLNAPDDGNWMVTVD